MLPSLATKDPRYDIPRFDWDFLAALLFTGQRPFDYRGGAIDLSQHLPSEPVRLRFILMNLQHVMARYHDIPFTRGMLPQRLARIREVERAAMSFPRLDELRWDQVVMFREHVRQRREYLSRLVDYLHRKRAKVNQLMNVFLNQQISNLASMKGESRYLGLHETRVMEGLDPFHRTETLKRAFNIWQETQMQRDLDPAGNLVQFFIDIEGYADKEGRRLWTDPINLYRNEEWVEIHKISFEETAAWSWYALLESYNPSPLLIQSPDRVRYYSKFDTRKFPVDSREVFLVERKKLHTLNTRTSEDGVREQYRDIETSPRGGPGEPNLSKAYIYVMRKNGICAYPVSDHFHSMGARGKAIQAAGLLVADNGKILAIDNDSGHYRPSSSHLAQAVEEIQTNGAFAAGAMVGVRYGYKRAYGDVTFEGMFDMFFPVAVFQKLAQNEFPLQETWQELQGLSRRYPRGPADFPNADKQAYVRFARLWQRIYAGPDGWMNAITDFIAHMHPERAILQALTLFIATRGSLDAGAFRRASWTIGFGRRDIEAVDRALERYDAELQRLTTELRAGQDMMRVLAMAQWVLQSAVELQEAIMTWQKENTPASGRYNAVMDLAIAVSEEKAVLERELRMSARH